MRMARCTSHSVDLLILRIHLGRIQESSTLNLVEDYVRFVLTFFEIINTSALHIYHSALPLSPRTSITHEMYNKHASPLVRIVRGTLPDSWERVVATANLGDALHDAVWSPCNKFIAVTKFQSVELLDAVTLGRLCIFKTPRIPEQLGFSPDSRFLTVHVDKTIISWDLQTGGQLGIITSYVDMLAMQHFSFKHSKDGEMVAAAYVSQDYDKYDVSSFFIDIDDVPIYTFIYTYDLLSARRVGSCRIPEGQIIHPIWTHDEHFRFATVHPDSIRIWQSSFALEHPPIEVTSLPVPDRITDAKRFMFLPSLSRLAFVLGGTIQVWDPKTPKPLLKSELTLKPKPSWDPRLYDPPCGSFNSDGRFFACTNIAGEVCIWKESPAGYLLHQQLPFFDSKAPRLSPNGESIIKIRNSEIRRWHTRDQVHPLPISTKGSRRGNSILTFSSNENFAAFGQRKEKTVTIIDLQSGEPRWIANVGVKIDCLRMAGSTVVLAGEEKIVTWNLPGGDSDFNASINDGIRTTVLHNLSEDQKISVLIHMSISSNLSRITVARSLLGQLYSWVEVYNVSTGLCLARVKTRGSMRPRFTQDGREVWVDRGNLSEKWSRCEITEDSKSGAIELKLQSFPHSKHEIFLESSSGYTVTDSSWVLSPSQKRLLWLPHRWRLDEWNMAWGGRFLGLKNDELSEVVILEFLE